MSKSAIALCAFMALLIGCSAEEEETVEERFKRTEAAILNTAESLEAETENAVRAAENVLETRADAFENNVAPQAAEVNEALADQAEGNQAR